MYLTPNLQALHVYGGTIGTYLRSPEATSFDLGDHSWQQIEIACDWLKANNPLIRSLCPELSIPLSHDERPEDLTIGALPFALLSESDREPPAPVRRPDLILNPFDFTLEVRNEDHRSHRLPAGTIQSSLTTLKYVINHGDKSLEMLLFPYLYPNGTGAWAYQGPALPR